jgi:thiol-disulfide isomerase/thioredoxin
MAGLWLGRAFSIREWVQPTGGFYMRVNLQVIFLASAISTTAYASTPGEVGIGGYLREAKLNGFSGETKKFSDFKGKPLIINVWASWCGPCRAEMGSLERLAHRYGGKQFNVIGISTDDDGNAAATYIKKSKITFDNFLDSKVFLENMLGANTIPLTVLVDEHGRVLEKVRGAYGWDSPEALDAISEIFHIKLKR